MRQPNESASSWAHIVFSVYTWASLDAWSQFPDLSEADRKVLGELAISLKAHIDALLKEARETQDAVLFARPLAQAKQNATLVLLRRRLASVLNTVADLIGNGSKDHPLVRQFLPNLLTGVSRSEMAERPRLARQASERLAKMSADLEGKDALVERLASVAAWADTAISGASVAYSSWTSERSEEVVEKGRLRLHVERVHRTLGAQFPGQRDFVESFFLKGERPSEGEADDPEVPA